MFAKGLLDYYVGSIGHLEHISDGPTQETDEHKSGALSCFNSCSWDTLPHIFHLSM
jgi:hypothetical protein